MKIISSFLDLGEDIGKPLAGPVGPSGETIGWFINSHAEYIRAVAVLKTFSCLNKKFPM
jgi:hypothetical protein